jgi:hypothetical protein
MLRKELRLLIPLFISILLACSCSQTTPLSIASVPTSKLTSTATTTSIPKSTDTSTPEVAYIDYSSAFGIDYAHPEQYLARGEQSRISDPSVLDSLRVDEHSLEHLQDIYLWLKREFTGYAAGGKTIGVVTVDQLLADRQLGGCHDHGLVYAAVARELGYPSIMARTVSIAWVERFQAGEQGPHVGHVFVEVYLNGKWIFIDSTNGWYLTEGYDPTNPVIPLRGNIAGSSDEIYGFYVERKGIDTWSFGIHSPSESSQAMDELALDLKLESISYPDYNFQHFSK